jgi:hypothetical protein
MSFIINPGSGPVADASHEAARQNMDAFVRDVLDNRDETVTIEDTGREDDGRFTFVLRLGDRSSEIDMPGIALEDVRYLGRPDQNIWDFPRLYEDGSSWVWLYAVSQSRHHLLEPLDPADS